MRSAGRCDAPARLVPSRVPAMKSTNRANAAPSCAAVLSRSSWISALIPAVPRTVRAAVAIRAATCRSSRWDARAIPHIHAGALPRRAGAGRGRSHAGTARRRMPCPAGGHLGRIISISAASPIWASMGTMTCRRRSADGAKSWNRPPRISASAPRPRNARTGSTDRASVVGESAMPMPQAYRPAGSAFPARTRRTGIPPRLRRGSRPPGRVSPGSPAGAGDVGQGAGAGPGHCRPGPAGRSARRRRRRGHAAG